MLPQSPERTKLACMAGPGAAPKTAERHPALEALAHAPIDDEPVTPEEEAAVEEARAAVRRGEVISAEATTRTVRPLAGIARIRIALVA